MKTSIWRSGDVESLSLPAPLMLSAILLCCLASAFRYSVSAGLLDRPLVIGFIWAAFSGEWDMTIKLALFFELFWLDLMYVGTYIPPFSSMSLLMCLLLVDYFNIDNVWQLPLPLLLSLPWALTGSAMERWMRQRQSMLYFIWVERGEAARQYSVPGRIFIQCILKLMALQAIVFAGCYTITENLGHLIVNWTGLPVFSWLNWGLLWTLGAAMGGFMALRTRRAYIIFAAAMAVVVIHLLS